MGRDPLAHLRGRLVGEGDRDHFGRVDVARRQQVGDPVGQDAGLAGPGPGDHQERAARVYDRLALSGVQPRQQGVDALGTPGCALGPLGGPVGCLGWLGVGRLGVGRGAVFWRAVRGKRFGKGTGRRRRGRRRPGRCRRVKREHGVVFEDKR